MKLDVSYHVSRALVRSCISKGPTNISRSLTIPLTISPNNSSQSINLKVGRIRTRSILHDAISLSPSLDSRHEIPDIWGHMLAPSRTLAADAALWPTPTPTPRSHIMSSLHTITLLPQVFHASDEKVHALLIGMLRRRCLLVCFRALPTAFHSSFPCWSQIYFP